MSKMRALRRRRIAVIVLLASSGAAVAVPPTSTLTGDWGGERTALFEHGIDIAANYVSEIASHPFDATRYADQWSLGATLDLDKLWGWSDAHFQITATSRHGRELGGDAQLDNLQLVQEVYGRGQTSRLTQLWYERGWAADRVDWKIGRMTVGEDFASFACDFQNLTFCGAQPGNVRGEEWYNWPVSQWATRLRLRQAESYVQFGAYQVNPRYIDNDWARAAGLYPNNPAGTTGTLLPLELAWLPTRAGLTGAYKIGFWYDTSNADDVYLDRNHQPLMASGDTPLRRNSRSGAYAVFEQQLDGAAGGNGVYLFFNATQTDRDTAPLLDRQVAGGMLVKGIMQRTADSAGFALGANHVNDLVARGQRLQNVLSGTSRPIQHTEYVAELFYGWSPLPFVVLRPNVQYLHHPGGMNTNGDLWIAGFKTHIDF